MIEQDSPAASPMPALSPEIEHIISRAEAGELPCPRCGFPLSARAFDLEGQPELLLFCQGEACEFEEF